MEGPTNNPIGLHNLYPGAQGSSVAQAGSEQTTGATNDMSESIAAHPAELNFARGLRESPVWTWLAFAFLTGLLMYLVTRLRGSAASNIKFTLFNLFVVTMLSILGGSIAKVLATRWHLPFGISTIIQAS